MKSLSFTAIIGSIRARVDRSIGATFVTPELTNEQRAYFFDLQNQNVEMIIAPIDEINAPEVKIAKDIESKSPSERLRNVLFLLFRQNAEGHAEFDSYYRRKMEGIIEHLKGKIEE